MPVMFSTGVPEPGVVKAIWQVAPLPGAIVRVPAPAVALALILTIPACCVFVYVPVIPYRSMRIPT